MASSIVAGIMKRTRAEVRGLPAPTKGTEGRLAGRAPPSLGRRVEPAASSSGGMAPWCLAQRRKGVALVRLRIAAPDKAPLVVQVGRAARSQGEGCPGGERDLPSPKEVVMAHIIVEEQYDTMPSEDQRKEDARKIDAVLEKRGGKWMRSYLSEEAKREICEFDAPDTSVVKDAYQQAGVAFERIYKADVSAVT